MWVPTKLSNAYILNQFTLNKLWYHKSSFRGVHVVLQLFVKVRITNRNPHCLSKDYILFSMDIPPPSVPLPYTVAKSTPHSGKYGPELILLDKPHDQSSRWSGAYQGNNSKQWILLKLDQMSVLSMPTWIMPVEWLTHLVRNSKLWKG